MLPRHFHNHILIIAGAHFLDTFTPPRHFHHRVTLPQHFHNHRGHNSTPYQSTLPRPFQHDKPLHLHLHRHQVHNFASPHKYDMCHNLLHIITPFLTSMTSAMTCCTHTPSSQVRKVPQPAVRTSLHHKYDKYHDLLYVTTPLDHKYDMRHNLLYVHSFFTSTANATVCCTYTPSSQV